MKAIATASHWEKCKPYGAFQTGALSLFCFYKAHVLLLNSRFKRKMAYRNDGISTVDDVTFRIVNSSVPVSWICVLEFAVCIPSSDIPRFLLSFNPAGPVVGIFVDFHEAVNYDHSLCMSQSENILEFLLEAFVEVHKINFW